MSRFIRVKISEVSEFGTYPARFAHINLDAITLIEEYPDDTSHCHVSFGYGHGTQVFMPAEALIAIIDHKKGGQP